jgi:phosphohistidine phosphatase
MKTLLLIRHAKSSWADSSQKDFDRPLNDRGHQDAPAMAKHLLEKKITIDVFISSRAKRALATCQYFAKAFDKKNKEIIQIQKLYEANVDTLFQVVSEVNNEFNSIAIFSHNPGITAFANSLTKVRIDDMPTCAIFAISAEINDWQAFRGAKKNFLLFDYPKMY